MVAKLDHALALAARGFKVFPIAPGNAGDTDEVRKRMTTAYGDWYRGARRQNWRTPRSLFEPLHAEYRFTLDGASEPGNALLPRASTADAPKSWRGERVFCNPPWSDIPPFIELSTLAQLAVLLVPARTNARWFHRALSVGASPRFFLGRVKFELEHEGPRNNSPVDCLLLVFNKRASLQELL